MSVFRHYMLNSRGQIEVGDWLEAQDLEDARRKAMESCRGRFPLCEIWQGHQRLAQFACAEGCEG